MVTIISSLIDFFMGKNDIQSLLEEVERLKQKKRYQDALKKINQAIKKVPPESKQKLSEICDILKKEEFECKSKDTYERIKRALKQNDLEYARQIYNTAHNNSEFTEEDDYSIEKEINYFSSLIDARELYSKDELDEAALIVQNAIRLYEPPREDACSLLKDICNRQQHLEKENARTGPQKILNFGYFNIAKKEYEGEDADPISIVDSNLNWGVVGVFDGMGGAGAKKYKHIESGEEHTSAYWGARIVRNSVADLIDERPLGISPVEWLKNHLHDSIKKTLDEKINDFSNANGIVLSKMTRKLPTTMAMSGYEITDGNAEITTFWAGDSRVYIIFKDTIKVLTIDDADAEDGDPFSPMNMDLAMNNAISQEREFRINKSFLKIKISHDDPFMLIAATDGCFGYYKNPIEFETMLRNSLAKANDCNEYLNNIQQSIIDNIQQDDFSISIVGFGSNTFEDYKIVLSSDADRKLIDNYFEWRQDIEKKRSEFKDKISQLETQILTCKDEVEQLHSIEEQKNMEWYTKYRDTISVINRDEIEFI